MFSTQCGCKACPSRATETKKITAKNFVQGAFGLVDNASIPATALSYPLSVGQIVTATLADNAVTNAGQDRSDFDSGNKEPGT